MDTETKKYIKRMGIFTLILVIVITCIVFLVKTINVLNEKIFNEFLEEFALVRENGYKVYAGELERVGANIKGLNLEKTYAKEIGEIKEIYGIDILTDEYYYLDEIHLKHFNMKNVTRKYVVNYEKDIIFCITPLKYKGNKYYTVDDIATKLKEGYSYKSPVIPTGFRHKEGLWNTGFVIADKYGNEFVWVPVAYLNPEDVLSVFKKYYGDRQNSSNKSEDYERLKKSVKKYGGYYIARYEASLRGATQYDSMGTSNIIQSVPYVLPITQITYRKEEEGSKIALSLGYDVNGMSKSTGEFRCAKELCDNMANDYKWGDGIHTSLMYSQTYDAFLKVAETLNYIALNDINNDSTNFGNYLNSEFRYRKTNESNYMAKHSGEGLVLPTGALLYSLTEDKEEKKNCIMNVYDIGGNVAEWTQEEYREVNAIVRGGSYAQEGTDGTIGNYDRIVKTFATSTIGIRPILYVD